MDTTLNSLGVPGEVTDRNRTRARPLTLPARAVYSLHGIAGFALLVDHGRLWITEPGDRVDHFIGAGQVYRVKSAGLVVLECDGQGGASFRLEDRDGKPRALARF